MMSEQVALFTIGSIITAATYLAKKFVFEPLLEFKKVKGRVHNRLKYHMNIITNGEFPKEIARPIQDEMRQLSCDFEEAYYALPLARHFPTLYGIPTFEKMNRIASNLVLFYNTTGNKDYIDMNIKAVEEVETDLGIKPMHQRKNRGKLKSRLILLVGNLKSIFMHKK